MADFDPLPRSASIHVQHYQGESGVRQGVRLVEPEVVAIAETSPDYPGTEVTIGPFSAGAVLVFELLDGGLGPVRSDTPGQVSLTGSWDASYTIGWEGYPAGHSDSDNDYNDQYTVVTMIAGGFYVGSVVIG